MGGVWKLGVGLPSALACTASAASSAAASSSSPPSAALSYSSHSESAPCVEDDSEEVSARPSRTARAVRSLLSRAFAMSLAASASKPQLWPRARAANAVRCCCDDHAVRGAASADPRRSDRGSSRRADVREHRRRDRKDRDREDGGYRDHKLGVPRQGALRLALARQHQNAQVERRRDRREVLVYAFVDPVGLQEVEQHRGGQPVRPFCTYIVGQF